MKKQTKIVIGIVLAVAVVIIAISFMFPTVFKGLTSGTFGKADKYHKTQMTEKDILLRSELVADSNELRNMIQGLIYFSLFTEDISNSIDSCVDACQSQGIMNDPKKATTMLALKDFSDYIKNNNKTLRATISLLTGFYLKDEQEQSADVEKNLRAFGNYVNNLNEKDSILELALTSIDNFMLSNRVLKTKKTELANLKAIRDQLLIGSVQLAGLIQDKPLSATLCSYAISSQAGLQGLLGQENLGVIRNQDNLGDQIMTGFIAGAQEKLNVRITPEAQQTLNMIRSQDGLGVEIVESQVSMGSAGQLNEIIQAQQLSSSAVKNQELGSIGNIIIYDKANLDFVVSDVPKLQNALSAAELNSVLSGSQNLGVVAFLSQQGLNLVGSTFDLQQAVRSQSLSSVLSSSQLNVLYGYPQGFGSIPVQSSFIGMMQQLGNMGIGVKSGQE